MKATIEEYAAGEKGAVVVKRLTFEDGKLVETFICPKHKGGAKIEELKAYANEQIKNRRVENTTAEKPTLVVSEEEIQAQADFYLSAGWQPDKVRQAINSGLIRDMIVEERLAEATKNKERAKRAEVREAQAKYDAEWQARYGEETMDHRAKTKRNQEKLDAKREEYLKKHGRRPSW